MRAAYLMLIEPGQDCHDLTGLSWLEGIVTAVK